MFPALMSIDVGYSEVLDALCVTEYSRDDLGDVSGSENLPSTIMFTVSGFINPSELKLADIPSLTFSSIETIGFNFFTFI